MFGMLFLVGFVLLSANVCCNAEKKELPLLMPGVKPTKPETYYCTSIKLKDDTSYYITGFIPQTGSGAAHHIIINGCGSPGSKDEIWGCGGMANSDSTLKQGLPCGSGSQMVYAWAHEAKELKLPKDVGFRVGGDSPIKYLVLQVHYHDISKITDDAMDQSGVILQYTLNPRPKTVGILLLGTNGVVEAGKTTYLESACKINAKKNQVIHPFAFRTHTHKHGKLVSGYKVQKRGNGDDKWELIGKENPQKPQMFYPISKDIELKNGDIAAARCTMDATNSDGDIYIGAGAEDEMCNFYMMYWVDGPHTLDQKYCWSFGAPFYSWAQDNKQFTNIPDPSTE